MPWFERLTTLDATFLAIEGESTPMHVGAVVVFDVGPLATADGGVDIDRIRAYIEAAIERVPRYRQRVAWARVPRHPAWVDDDRFNIHYHVRHTALPRPGDARQLKRLAGRIFSQRLDRGRPLWEFWVVEGLAGGRFAMITKAHHCMVDGMAGVALMAALLRTTTDATIPKTTPFTPRPAPGVAELSAAEVRYRARGAAGLFDRLRAAWSGARVGHDLFERAGELAGGLFETVAESVVPASRTPLWADGLSPYRRFDTVRLPLTGVKAVKRALGGKVNDVVLATVSGALRRFFERRGSDPDAVEDCRAFVPVATRSSGAALGNQVSMMLAHLPLAEAEPRRRYAAVVAETERLKASSQVASGEVAAEAADYTGAQLVARTVRLAAELRPYNLVVTNVPGPPFPLYLLGAQLREVYPYVPLYGHTSVGIALFSYAGGLFWGLSGDWQAVPDLHDLVADVQAAFDELGALAATSQAP